MSILAEKLRVEVEADTDPATREMRKMEDEGNKIPKWAKAAGAAMAAAFTTGAIVKGIGAAITAASDLSEVTSKTNQVFGDSTGIVTGYAQQMADDFGIVKTTALDAASGFGLLGSAAGIVGDPLAQMSTGLAQAAADASSFYNVPLEDALAAIKSGLVGEAEPLRAYGVLLNDAAVQAKAMEMGIWDGNSAMTEAQKVQARTALIMAGLATSSGDLERTQEGVANSTRELQGRFTNLAADIGGYLLPAAAGVLGWANDAVASFAGALPGAIEWLGTTFGNLWSSLQGSGGVLDTIGEGLKVLRDIGEAVGRSFLTGLMPSISGLAGSFQPLLALLPQLVGLFSPFGLVLKALTPVLPQLAAMVGQLVGALATALVPILTAIIPVITQVAGILVGALSQAFIALLPAVMSLVPIITELVGILGGVLLTVVQAVTPLILMLAGVLGELLPALMPLVGAVLEVVGALLPLVAVAGDLIGAILPVLVELIMALLTPIVALVQPLIGALVPALTALAGIITGAVVPIVKVMAQVLAALVSAIAPVVSAIAGGLISALGGLIQWVTNTASSIVQFVARAVGAFNDFASTAGQKVGEVVGWFRDLPSRIMGAIGSLAGMMRSAGSNIIEALADGIRSAVGKATKAVSGVLDAVRDFLPFSPAKEGPFSGRGWSLYSGRSITGALADGMMDELRSVRDAGLAVATAAAMNLPGATIGAPTASQAILGPSGTVPGASAADSLGVGSASGYSGPSTLVIVDADGELIGTMRVQAGKVATGEVTPLDEGRTGW